MNTTKTVRLAQCTPPCPFCPTPTKVGVHSRADQRYRCHQCKKTFTQTNGTPLYGLKTDFDVVFIILTLLIFGCPIPAVVAAFKVDERTLADWIDKAGEHAQRVQGHLVCQGNLELRQVQADELWCRSQRGVLWLATAMSVSARLLIWGKVASGRTEALMDAVVLQVHRATRLQSPILWATDGFSTWTGCIMHHFRSALLTGRRGHPALVQWAELHIVQVIKRTYGERIERRLAWGDLFEALHLIETTQGKPGTINTAFVERLNATLRTWLPALTRRSRHAGSDHERLERHFFLVLVAYNFIRPRRSLQRRVDGRWIERTAGMAASLTDHPWPMEDLLSFRLPPSQAA
ncbi:transposase [Deinococcus saxicola]|uniref:transposase n=1 Tax=Deinococcus saxicola TaxID=249406 RepID=UPI0039EE9893